MNVNINDLLVSLPESYTDDSVNSSARVDYMLYLSVLAVLASTRIL